MGPIYDDDRGYKTEERFLQAVKERNSDTPSWFRGVRRAGPKFDIKGIDFSAKIKRHDDEKYMSVPVQIKSSKSGRNSYYEKHPEAKAVGVIVLVVHDGMKAGEIRQRLYGALEPFLHVPRDHFKAFFDGAHESKMSRRGRALRKHIVQKRREQRS